MPNGPFPHSVWPAAVWPVAVWPGADAGSALTGAPPVASPSMVTQGNARPRLDVVYCTDEDVAVRAPFDYAALCPRDQVKAQGSDGAFYAGSPWVLTSAAVDFEASGVGPNDVVALTEPRASFPSPFGALFAVDSALAGTLTLRRVGGYLGEGAPPVTGALAAVRFKVPTFRAQIDDASYDINETHDIDPAVVGMQPSSLYRQRDLRQYAVLLVLKRAYTAAMESATGDYKEKLALVSSDLENLLARLTVRWGVKGEDRAPSGLFMRVVR